MATDDPGRSYAAPLQYVLLPPHLAISRRSWAIFTFLYILCLHKLWLRLLAKLNMCAPCTTFSNQSSLWHTTGCHGFVEFAPHLLPAVGEIGKYKGPTDLAVYPLGACVI